MKHSVKQFIDSLSLTKLMRANNVLMLFAVCSGDGWLVYFAFLFWGFVLFVLIRKDVREKSLSVATVGYATLLIAIAALCVFVLFA